MIFPHRLSQLYITEHCNDKIPTPCFDTVIDVDPITHQTFNYANQIPCEGMLLHPQNVIA